MSIEVGSTIYGSDGKEIKIIITSCKMPLKAYIDTHGSEVELDVFSIASIIRVLFGSLNEKQRENLIKELINDYAGWDNGKD